MKLFIWDFHGVLEKNTERAAKEITNRVLEEFNVPNRASDDDIERRSEEHTSELQSH